MERKRSSRPVKTFEEISLPFVVTFPIPVEISVNQNFWKYPSRVQVYLTFKEYEALAHSNYAKYLGH